METAGNSRFFQMFSNITKNGADLLSNTRYAMPGQPDSRISARLLYVTTSKYEGDWSSIPHTHYFAEFFYVLSGRGRFQVESEQFEVRADDLIIVNPNIEHTELSLDQNPLEYIVLGVDKMAFDFDGAGAAYSVYNYGAQRDRLLSYLREMLREIEGHEKGYEVVCQNLLEVLVLNMMRSAHFSMAPVDNQKTSKECSAVKRYIDSNFGDDISLDTLAKRTHLNKYYLVHAFTRANGISPINYLIERRIEGSKQLLESTNHNISQIARIVGFSSQSYFSQSFKRLTGMTPAQYRKQARQAEAAPQEKKEA